MGKGASLNLAWGTKFVIRELRMSQFWNRCDVCGQFISFDDFAEGIAIRKLDTPDSEFTKESYETLCKEHSPASIDGDARPL